MPTERPGPEASLPATSPAEEMSRLEEVGQRASEYLHQAKATNTKRAYKAD
jgi:hypothetical protein